MVIIKEITGKTRICGLIGDPVAHTISPAMHNAAFTSRGLDYVYVPFPVKQKDLSKAIDGMRALDICGLNVTIPYKIAVIPLLDEMDSLAEQIGAVNTIVSDNGKLKGYNTDALGFLQVLLKNGIEPKGKRVVLLGAGGAARAIAFALANHGAELTILNRKQELDWAVALAAKVSKAYGKEIGALELDSINLKKTLAGADILVNATSVGMSPNIEETLVTADLLRPGLVVYDIVYNPAETRFLREARQAGAQTISGLDMLVGQGAAAFELWTGQKAPVDIMKQVAVKALQE
jgi:shikimate dehydrogenase